MNQSNHLKIGTRDSKLATWQAQKVSDFLTANHLANQLHFIKSEGDINLTTPLYEVGVQGIFTKALDIALLNNEIDIAVHSFKDVPTQLAAGLQIAAILKRDNPLDVLVFKNETTRNNVANAINNKTTQQLPIHIATSSIRRKAQWLHAFPLSTIDNIRGNVITRIEKLHAADWDAAIFAAAGLERLGLTESITGPQLPLPWMLPAPAQGAMVVICRENDEQVLKACAGLHDEHTAICTHIERDFLRALMGGCATPIGAFAAIENGIISFTGNVTAIDGKDEITVIVKTPLEQQQLVATEAATLMVQKGIQNIKIN
ncbi:hydroxymethylbilane synthase [Ferruginibacter yonginensis]|uniref:Hydroxymethylbilane synthase n=1 Tax=Ferruginibacter yonginensis TaxID=1310416 RepID=A0ABV8QN70_9BACT